MTERSHGPEADDEPGTDAQGVLDVAQADPAALPGLLLLTSSTAAGRAVLAEAFAAGRELIVDAHWQFSPEEADSTPWRCSGYGSEPAAEASATLLTALWQALRLVPETERAILRHACALDPRLLRHALAWGDEGGPDRDWLAVAVFVAEVADRRAAVPAERGFVWSAKTDIEHQLQSTPPAFTRALGADLLRAHSDAIDDTMLDEVAARFSEPLDFLVALGEADPELARRRAGRSELERYGERLGRWTPKQETELREPELRWATAARFLPLETLVAGDDAELQASVATAIARLLVADGRPRTPDLVAAVLARPEMLEDDAAGRWAGLSLLWAELIQLVSYGWGNRAASAGVVARLDALVEEHPEAWRDSVRPLVHRHADLDDGVLDRLLLAAARHPDTAAALRDVAAREEESETRDVAGGLVARLDGAFVQGGGLQRWIADTAARAYDGAPFFPNPLTPLTATWTGAPALDDALRQATLQTMSRFAGYVRDHGAAVEEHLVGVLLLYLETGLGAVSARVQPSEARLARSIAIKHRPSHKRLEESTWGCDVALLLRVDVAGIVDLEMAELVQVKKSQAIGDGRDVTDRWRIGVVQLRTLLERSDGAVYWLVLADGTVVCVPAAWLLGLCAGHGALNQKTFTVHYHEVRSAAIPMEQMLGELLLGTWLGSTRSEVVGMVTAERPNLVPRHVLEIVIRAAAD